MEAVQRVLELEAAVDQLRLEKTDLSYRLKQELQRNGRAPDAGGPAASDTGSEVRSRTTPQQSLRRWYHQLHPPRIPRSDPHRTAASRPSQNCLLVSATQLSLSGHSL